MGIDGEPSPFDERGEKHEEEKEPPKEGEGELSIPEKKVPVEEGPPAPEDQGEKVEPQAEPPTVERLRAEEADTYLRSLESLTTQVSQLETNLRSLQEMGDGKKIDLPRDTLRNAIPASLSAVSARLQSLQKTLYMRRLELDKPQIKRAIPEGVQIVDEILRHVRTLASNCQAQRQEASNAFNQQGKLLDQYDSIITKLQTVRPNESSALLRIGKEEIEAELPHIGEHFQEWRKEMRVRFQAQMPDLQTEIEKTELEVQEQGKIRKRAARAMRILKSRGTETSVNPASLRKKLGALIRQRENLEKAIERFS